MRGQGKGSGSRRNCQPPWRSWITISGDITRPRFISSEIASLDMPGAVAPSKRKTVLRLARARQQSGSRATNAQFGEKCYSLPHPQNPDAVTRSDCGRTFSASSPFCANSAFGFLGAAASRRYGRFRQPKKQKGPCGTAPSPYHRCLISTRSSRGPFRRTRHVSKNPLTHCSPSVARQ